MTQPFFDRELVRRFLGSDDFVFDGSGLRDHAWRSANTANCIVVDRGRGGTTPVVSVLVEVRDDEHRAALTSQLVDDAQRLTGERALRDLGGLGTGYSATSGRTQEIAVLTSARMIRVSLDGAEQAPSVETALTFARDADANAAALDGAHA